MLNQTGWICPNCGRGNAPTTPWCCVPVAITVSNIGTSIPETLKLCPHGFTIKSNCYECMQGKSYELGIHK